eukprot:gnl/MRDRNA2_/MRDRNA2_123596_c0_seq1.p1 gnl/MRDRNA2_/MRDRNA2_123596_c0~~gnl/MRDRNA2_/MRDRNA2_123596_c0_seq1.p1  ORF type:complete len:295 (-),score=60.98 gnl/MRDRNA2_/MRDRNA2_123596_c0_seq1:209-1093(-)
MTETMEFVHDWIVNPLATKEPKQKLTALERAKGLFLKSLKSGDLKAKLQEIKDCPWLIQKEVIKSPEASQVLSECARDNRIPQLKLLIERGYDTSQNVEPVSGDPVPESQANWSVAHEAVMANACDALKELMEHGLEVKQVKSNEGWTLVHAAAYSGSTAALKIVLDAGCAADLPDIYKRTPLYWATICGRFTAARLLIWHKADLTAEDQWRNTPLSWAQAHSAGQYTAELSDLIIRAANGEFDGSEEPPVDVINEEDDDKDEGSDSDNSEVFQSRTFSIIGHEKEPKEPKEQD